MTGEERRGHPRLISPYLVVHFGGGEYTTQNWSFGGMLITGYAGELSAGSLLTIEGLGAGDGPVAKTSTKARVVRADPNSGTLALTFLDIDTECYAILADLQK